MSETLQRSAGRPVDIQKTHKVFDAIDCILASEGISGLSIERIARNAGISKATLYRRFGNIHGILTAYVETFTQQALRLVIPKNKIDLTEPVEIEEILIDFGFDLMSLICHPRIIAFDNAMLAAGKQFADFKTELYRNGPEKAIIQISVILEQAHISSSFFDIKSLADILFHIWRSGIYDQARISGKVDISPEQLKAHVISGTRFFLSTTLPRSSNDNH
ncbi:TetR/AcrR family transcriptional regulator [Moritella viscosa]|uniref:Transcriptional regulator n=1 Tax=Moritella viscosa TaxID=80854 RepID=A0A090IHZ6_9GAMM|nr:TetR/AcrR family transcriptional regulator [Moritella viscosa]CED59649.1 HTH-type transcriptional regulator, TetR family [Moritella viscosa]SGY89225.1 Transcriptional regulator [Moritella viscosa]SGY91386.1 Transcriptional regulator [Moritella viscosa]SGY91826.1 Transcriptional regulator [Moritella viscosa]SGZ02962.1 Transcriptional regulator [Moritella viscosa]